MNYRIVLASAALLASACGTEVPAPGPAAAADAAVADAAGGGDGTGAEDGAAADAAVAPDTSNKNMAKVYINDPTTDSKATTLVPLRPPTSADGKLTGAFAQVFNCLPEEGGEPIKRGGFAIGSLCHEVQTAVPAADGSYLQVAPPADDKEMGDPFAELMMYYHVNQIHDYFHDQFGLTDLNYPVYALVNVTISVFGGWQGFPNAAFMPKEAFAQFNLPPREKGAIVFGQYQSTDFSYDASVIYHEYVHAMVGTTRLLGVLIDSYGLDNLPGAMNEGFADYFSCSLRDSPVIGSYALAFAGEHAKRDLSIARKCPDDLTTEIHADGKIIGSGLWEIRKALGRDTADGIILAALQQFSQQTNVDAASKLILAEAKKVSAEIGAKVKTALEAHGMLQCVRAKKLEDFSVGNSVDKVPYAIESPNSMGGGPKFVDGLPGFVQFFVDVPSDAKAVQIRWKAEAQSGAFGGGGPDPSIGLAIRKGKAPQINLFDGGSILADAKVKPVVDPNNKNARVITLTGNCINSGSKLFMMLLNSGGKGAMTEITRKFLPSADGQPGVVQCGP